MGRGGRGARSGVVRRVLRGTQDGEWEHLPRGGSRSRHTASAFRRRRAGRRHGGGTDFGVGAHRCRRGGNSRRPCDSSADAAAPCRGERRLKNGGARRRCGSRPGAKSTARSRTARHPPFTLLVLFCHCDRSLTPVFAANVYLCGDHPPPCPPLVSPLQPPG